MSFAGHVLDMMKRMKKNRALQKKHRSSFSQRARNTGSSGKINYVNEDFPVLSEEEQNAIRNELNANLKKDKQQLLLLRIIFITAFVGSLLLFYLWFYF